MAFYVLMCRKETAHSLTHPTTGATVNYAYHLHVALAAAAAAVCVHGDTQ